MPTRLTDLTEATAIAPDDLLYAVVGGNSRRIKAAALAGRNRIINGQGRINQRGYVSGTNTTGANQYTLDRWRVVVSGQSLTFTGNDSRRIMTAPAGGCEQVIEGANIEGGTYVLNWDGTATATVNGVARTKGETFTLPANANATVRFISGTFSDVQVELGSLATVFERLPLTAELARCQSFFISFGGTNLFERIGQGQCLSPTEAFVQVALPVTMRVVPTIVNSGNFVVTAAGGTSTAVTSIGSPSSTRNLVTFTATVASGLVAGNATIFLTNNSTAARFALNAEI